MRHMIPMLSQFPITRWPLLMAGGSLLMMFGAWGFQYIGHYDPCALCFDQRHIHITVILIGLASGVALMGRPDLARLTPWVMFLLAAVLLYSAGFAGWHAGIENHWWEGPSTCTSSGGSVEVGDLLAAISGGRPMVMCDEAAWRMLGISMAGYNALISAGMAGISAWVAIKGLRAK